MLGKKIVKSLNNFNSLNCKFLWRKAKCLHRIWGPVTISTF